MAWLLGISVVLNLILLALVGWGFCLKLIADQEAEFYRSQWEKWECRWWEAVLLVKDETGKHLRLDGMKTKMKLE